MNSKGFTLIELLIVVAILGILAAIVYPSYRQYVLKSHRSDAQADMLEAAQNLERCYTANLSYQACSAVVPATAGTAYTLQLSDLDLDLDLLPGQTYTLIAEPIGNQNDDPCGTLELQHTGVKSADSDNCW